MKLWSLANVALVTVPLLASCATTFSISTNKDAAYKEYLQKVAVVVETSDLTVTRLIPAANPREQTKWETLPMADVIARAVAESLNAEGIESQPIIKDQLALDEAALKKQIDSYAPSQVLSIQLTSGTVDATNRLLKGTFDLTIFDTSLNKSVWRAKLALGASGGYSVFGYSSVKSFADQLLQSLEKDGLAANLAPAK